MLDSDFPRRLLLIRSCKASLEGHALSCPKYLGADEGDTLQTGILISDL